MDEAFDDDHDPDFELDADPGVGACEPAPATLLRATILAGGRVCMTAWSPSLADSGPMAQFLRSRERAGVAIADVRLAASATGEREVIVEFMAAGRARAAAEVALWRWASDAGHDRIWLPDGPLDLPRREGLATATVRCPTCRASWTDASPPFWHYVHDRGHFPLTCMTCGHPLPQWEVVAGDATRCRG